MTALLATGCQHDAIASRDQMHWQGAAAPCQLAERPSTSIKRKAVVTLALPLAHSARGGVSGTTALMARVTRQLRGAGQGRSSVFATDQTTSPSIRRK